MNRFRHFSILAFGLVFSACTDQSIIAPAEDGSSVDKVADMAVATGCDGGPSVCGCTSDGDCAAPAPRCDKNSSRCVPCLPLNDNCPQGSRCVQSNESFRCFTGCQTAADCPKSDGGAAPECCNSACLDTTSDIKNCGGCATACPGLPNALPACTAGVCGLGTCNSGFANCDNNPANGCEVDLNGDARNCGACGKACVGGANAAVSCMGGACSLVCAMGFADCDKNPANGCETNLASDLNNCGACGAGCNNLPNAKSACLSGACSVTSCATGFSDCNMKAQDGCEVDLRADLSNCGACGKACPKMANASSDCRGGLCVIAACGEGFADCDGLAANGCEVTIASDAKNCGTCSHACAVANGSPACQKGVCSVDTCNPGFADCDGVYNNGCETATTTDLGNCGGCGKACGMTAHGTSVCKASMCAVAGCNFGYADCDGMFANGCEANLLSPMTCGQCNNACPAPPNATAGCNAGNCAIGMCQPLFGDCNKVLADGCEKSLAADPANCGACGKVCAPVSNGTVGCLNGQCGIQSCAMGYADCDGQLANGCEANLNSDQNNCGGCGKPCAQGLYCIAASCTMCPATTDGAACNAPTSLGKIPVGGTATRTSTLVPAGRDAWYTVTFTQNTNAAFHPHILLSTNPGNQFVFDLYADCNQNTVGCVEGGKSISRTDWETGFTAGAGGPGTPNHQPVPLPGTAGTLLIRVYRPGPILGCDAFTITISNVGSCDPRMADCDGVAGCETDVMDDPANCGGCAKACSTSNISASCVAGACNGSCNAGYADCNTDKFTDGCEINTASDPNNCGTCGKACSKNNIAQPACAGAVCSGVCNANFADCDGDKLTNGCECNLTVNACAGSKCLLKPGQACTSPTQCASGTCLNALCS